MKRQEGRRVDTSVVPTMANGTCARCASMLSDPITHLYSSVTGGGGGDGGSYKVSLYIIDIAKVCVGYRVRDVSRIG